MSDVGTERFIKETKEVYDQLKEPKIPDPGPVIKMESGTGIPGPKDPWIHRSNTMLCRTCMYYVPKEPSEPQLISQVGRCRRHAPTMSGYPVVFLSDWCGDHKLDENRA